MPQSSEPIWVRPNDPLMDVIATFVATVDAREAQAASVAATESADAA